jgi:hypothetical protein
LLIPIVLVLINFKGISEGVYTQYKKRLAEIYDWSASEIVRSRKGWEGEGEEMRE